MTWRPYLILGILMMAGVCAYTDPAYYFNSSTTPIYTNATGYTEYLRITVPPVSGSSTWMVIGYLNGWANSTAGQARFHLYQNSSYQMLIQDYVKANNNGETLPQFYGYIYTHNSNAGYYYTWDYSSSAAAANISVQSASLLAIRIDNLSGSNYNNTRTTTERVDVNNTWNDHTNDSIWTTISPTSTGDYLIMFTGILESDSTSDSVAYRLSINGSEYIPYLTAGDATYSYARFEDTNTNIEFQANILAVRRLNAGWNNISVHIADTTTTASADWKYTNLAVVRLTDVFRFFNGSAITETTSTTTTYANHSTLTIPANNAGTYTILSTYSKRGGTASVDYLSRTRIGDTTIFAWKFRNKDVLDYVPETFMWAYDNSTFGTTEKKLSIEYAREDASGTEYIKNSQLLAIMLTNTTPSAAPPSTSCDCPSSGTTWLWDFGDNCNISVSCNIGAATIYVKDDSAGTWTFSNYANITAQSFVWNGTTTCSGCQIVKGTANFRTA
jgi:hypothetical protein